ncbi:VanW family protein [Sphaerisporangium sp. NPDC051011]|uniref:VanW family protein n=1 Tax=Sphaerisporangium sp. NPDC051011 TaxID=3155792 RepID=UPI00340687D9
MRNAGASIDPPPDPFAAVRPETPVALPADRKAPADPTPGATPPKKKLPRGVTPLPPGVSPEMLIPPAPPPKPAATPGPSSGQPGTLPPPSPPAQPWPMTGTARVRWSMDDPDGQPSIIMVPEPPPGKSRLRRFLVVAGGLALLFLFAYVVPATFMWGKVLPGTHVAGVEIGGLTETEALDRVHARFDGNDQQDLSLLLRGRPLDKFKPAEVGLAIDAQSTVAEAETGFPAPADVLQAFTGEQELPLKISTNHVKLAQRVRKIAKTIDRPAREGRIVYEGTRPRVIPPREGVALDRQATEEAIRRAFVNGPASSAATLTVVTVRPKASQEAFAGFLDDARRAVSGPITLTNGSQRAVLSPAVIAANLVFEPQQNGMVEPKFDARKAVGGVEAGLVGVTQAPRAARFVIENGAPKLVPARAGRGIDDAELTSALTRLIDQGGSRTIPVSLAITRPSLTDAEALKLGVKEKVGEFTTSFSCCAARVTNIQRAARLVDGLVVRPGDTFSLNEAIGAPTVARGFIAAQAIEDDHLVIAMGGGVSQFATTMYNAAYFAGMDDVEHTTHTFHVVRYPPGRDAAVEYPDQDLRWKNGTEHGVLITTASTGTSVTVNLWSTRTYDKIEAETSERTAVTQPETVTDDDPRCLPMGGGPGFTVTVTRVFSKDGEVVRRDKPATVTYEPQRKVVCQDGGSLGAEGSGPRRRPDAKPDIAPTPDPTPLHRSKPDNPTGDQAPEPMSDVPNGNKRLDGSGQNNGGQNKGGQNKNGSPNRYTNGNQNGHGNSRGSQSAMLTAPAARNGTQSGHSGNGRG